MKKTITQRLVDELKIYRSLRTYFDDGSSEFDRTDYDEKITTLIKIISHGFDLNEVITQYKSNYNREGYQHVYNNVAGTLKKYISLLKTGEFFNPDVIIPLRDAPEEEIIKQFIEALKDKIKEDQNS